MAYYNDGYTSADKNVGRIGQYFDPEGHYEYGDEAYLLVVYDPPRCSRVSNLFSRWSDRASTSRSDRTTDHHQYTQRDLKDMPTIEMRLNARNFPYEFRCEHARRNRRCQHGCYLVERGGSHRGPRCGKSDCEGHVYADQVKEVANRVRCFGRSGSRLVLLK